ncbi:glutathione S-transferase 1-1 [Halyomorpha halys]|uniref:glutathione S-transferase 1-1 n=1 Tax=Halyomorpha halys TaxID=286706 RepID=UPI0006D4DCCB|nr:glutathione S-transferase 1-1-like [Halyomorpha halys]XP_014284598.1 glutathione S-transferase 1-1-like [Halyomorpha halys]
MELYYNPLSRPSLSVILLSRALELNPELKEIDILGKEQYTEEYMKINPQHTVPFLVDDDLSLSESGAIMIYLVEAYGKDDSLYPNNPKQRAVINQRILFDAGTLWVRIMQCFMIPVLHQNMGVNDLLLERVHDAFTTLNSFLENKQWAAGDELTVADYCLVTTVACAEAVGYDISKHSTVSDWFSKCKETMADYDDLIQNAMNNLSAIFKEKLSNVEP